MSTAPFDARARPKRDSSILRDSVTQALQRLPAPKFTLYAALTNVHKQKLAGRAHNLAEEATNM
eukprot:6089297-Pleurochrysis_carterae.AAC.2